MGSVFQRKHKTCVSWYIAFTDHNGKRRQERAEGARTEAQARKILRHKEEQEDKARFNAHWQDGSITEATLSELAEEFLKYSKDHKKSWVRDDSSIKHLARHLGAKKVADIRPADIEAYISKRKAEKVTHRRKKAKGKAKGKSADGEEKEGKTPAPATINRELACLKTIFSRAIKNGRLRDNPVSHVSMLKEDNKRDRVLTPDEFQAYMNEAPGWFRPFALLACFTGMRASEALSLSWEQVDLRAGWITLKGENVKTGESRAVPLNREVVEALRTLRHGADAAIGPVFVKPDGSPFTYETLRYWHKKICRDTGIKDFHWHDWRHVFVTLARKSGKADRAIMRVTGHKTDSMLRRYDTVDRDDCRAVVEGLDISIMAPEKGRAASTDTSTP